MSEEISKLIEHRRVLVQCMEEKQNDVTADFSGGGDSGEITAVYFMDTVWTDLPDDARKAAEALAYHYLERQGLDWYNNEGGQGSIKFLRDGTVEVSTDINVMTTETHNDEYDMDREFSVAKLRGEAA